MVIEFFGPTIEYLELNFTDREIGNLAAKIEATLKLISANPKYFRNMNLVPASAA